MTTQDVDRKEQLGLIASKCRSEGVILIVGSQRPFDKDLGGKLRAMLTDIVWGKLKARDLSQASGWTRRPAGHERVRPGPRRVLRDRPLSAVRRCSPILLGRTFFWGEHSDGLIEIIDGREDALGGERPMQTLEAGLDERFGRPVGRDPRQRHRGPAPGCHGQTRRPGPRRIQRSEGRTAAEPSRLDRPATLRGQQARRYQPDGSSDSSSSCRRTCCPGVPAATPRMGPGAPAATPGARPASR